MANMDILYQFGVSLWHGMKLDTFDNNYSNELPTARHTFKGATFRTIMQNLRELIDLS